jgi:hypothetical protein
MATKHVLVLALGATVGGLAAAALLPIAVASADDCSVGDCTLVSAGAPIDPVYEGFRPIATQWTSTQPVEVQVAQPGGGDFISGTYNVSEQDFTSPFVDQGTYQYGDFTTAATNVSGSDSMGLSGVTVNDLVIGPGAGVDAAGNPTAEFTNMMVNYPSGTELEVTDYTGHFLNVFESSATGSGDWVQLPGQAGYTLLWDSLSTPSMPDLADLSTIVFPPDSWGPDLASAFPPELL